MSAHGVLAPAVTVEALSAGDRDACRAFDDFVARQPGATPFHTSRWLRAVATGLGHRPYLLAARTSAAIVAVLPLVHVRSRLFGQSLVSTAFGVQGGPLGEDGAAIAALDDAAWTLARTLRVPVLEYRGGALRPGWAAKHDVYANFARPLLPDSEANLKAIPRKQRAEVRKSLEFELATTVGRGSEHLDRHYAVYAESVRNLGTPVFPRSLFRAIIDSFSEDADILTVHKDGRAIASVLSLYMNDVVYPYYGGGTDAARTWRGNDHMYWMLMEHARARGCTVFDFGRSKVGTGAYAFKKNWGFDAAPLVYQYRLAEGAAVPDLNPNSPRYARMVRMWQRLPLWLANLVGPPIARNLG